MSGPQQKLRREEMRSFFVTLTCGLVVAVGLGTAAAFAVGNLKQDTHRLGGVIAHGIMPWQIPPATMEVSEQVPARETKGNKLDVRRVEQPLYFGPVLRWDQSSVT